MSKCPDSRRMLRIAMFTAATLALGVAGGSVGGAAPKQTAATHAKPLGIGRQAKPEEIAGWDIDIRPDGQGLPPGKGTVKQGEAIYMQQCAACHGEFGESAGRWPATIRSNRSARTGLMRRP